MDSFQLRPGPAQWCQSHLNQEWVVHSTKTRAHNPCTTIAREGPRGKRRQKGETLKGCKCLHPPSHYSKQICTKRYPFSDKWVSKQYSPWFKAGLMWQTFKSSSVGPVLTREIKKWVGTSFQFRIQFCSIPWIDKIPTSQKCIRLEEVWLSFQGYRMRHKKIILIAVPNPWRMVYPKSGLLLLLFP